QVFKKVKQGEYISIEDIDGLDRALVNYQKAGKLAMGESTEKETIRTELISHTDLSDISTEELILARKLGLIMREKAKKDTEDDDAG
ncbi:MAG: hypothetical protein U9P49_10900, partial [Thermodesulfobacteriota bacterium]|nr:hypothetical protein [Thermodesulfobacteriota bacterium]